MEETQTVDTPKQSANPRAGLHRELGADFAERAGKVVATRYGAVPDEVGVLREACGLIDRSWIDRLEARGPDRERFFSGMVTCEVRELGSRGGAYGFITSRKGSVVADFALLSFDDRFLLELPSGRAAAVTDHLKAYLLADRVELVVAEDRVPWTVAGPTAKKVLHKLLGDDLPDGAESRWGHGATTVAGVAVDVASRPRLGVEAWTIWSPAASGEAVAREILAAGASPVGYDALETVRIEAGVPLWGADYGDSNLPQEVGPDEALNFTKGCYLGQEVVARIHYRGGVKRRLVGLELDGDEPPERGTGLLLEERPVGVVGSVTVSPTLEGPIGLAIVHKKAAEPGTRLDLADGGEAEVAELPFVE